MTVLSLFDGISCGMIALERAGIKVDKYVAYGETHYTHHNTCFKDVIIDVAGQTGTNTALFLKAFRSMETNEETIELYN